MPDDTDVLDAHLVTIRTPRPGKRWCARTRELLSDPGVRTHVIGTVRGYARRRPPEDGNRPPGGLLRGRRPARRHDGNRVREPRRVDWERQADIAERAFESNGFMLAGDRQVERLDELIDLAGEPDLVFINLVPLAGG